MSKTSANLDRGTAVMRRAVKMRRRLRLFGSLVSLGLMAGFVAAIATLIYRAIMLVVGG